MLIDPYISLLVYENEIAKMLLALGLGKKSFFIIIYLQISKKLRAAASGLRSLGKIYISPPFWRIKTENIDEKKFDTCFVIAPEDFVWISWKGEKKHMFLCLLKRGGHLDSILLESLESQHVDRPARRPVLIRTWTIEDVFFRGWRFGTQSYFIDTL